jgi:CubicO group peptidase (beta-lactamase class C family)
MRRLSRAVGLAGALALGACAGTPPSNAELPRLDRPSQVLFWSQAEREAGFRAMDRIAPHRVVRAGGAVRPLPNGVPLDIDVSAYMAAEKVAGMLVIQDGRIRLERYGLGFGPNDRWTSFSVAKSVTSTLVGAALADGSIESLETPIVRYLPELSGSAYDGVTVRQLLTMTSGVAWNEDYNDPNSDVARFFEPRESGGMDPTLAYMRALPHAADPGTRWHYSTGETSLVGVLISRVTGQTLADYLSRTLWRPYGMEQDAAWMIDEAGQEPGGCCLVASLRDWGRFGQFILNGGRIGDRPVLPADYLAQATSKQADTGSPDSGYGFQWTTFNDGTFGGRGIFGQAIQIDPERRLVVVILSAWPVATDRRHTAARADVLSRISAAADR